MYPEIGMDEHLSIVKLGCTCALRSVEGSSVHSWTCWLDVLWSPRRFDTKNSLLTAGSHTGPCMRMLPLNDQAPFTQQRKRNLFAEKVSTLNGADCRVPDRQTMSCWTMDVMSQHGHKGMN